MTHVGLNESKDFENVLTSMDLALEKQFKFEHKFYYPLSIVLVHSKDQQSNYNIETTLPSR